MKRSTLFTLMASLLISAGVYAQQTCTADATKVYWTSNAGWTASEWYNILNIDAETLTTEGTGMIVHSGTNGTQTSTTYNSGTFLSTVMGVDAQMNPVATNVKWPVKYYMSCLAKDFFNSSYTKVVELGTNPSAAGAADAPCFFNNNTVIASPIWNKKGFIELSRLASEVANTPPSRHGYIELTDLPQVERIQWSFSSTGWKRGVKLSIKHGNGAWEPLRWVASDVASSIASFSEQGYAFEEIIGKQEDATSKISLRWTIWDGDTIGLNPTKTDGSKYTTTLTPYAQKQVVRIHQIKVFSGIVPETAPSGIKNNQEYQLNIFKTDSKIVLSEMANVELVSIEGKMIFKGKTNEIGVENLSKGVYVVRAKSDDGRLKNQKIIL